MKRKRRLHKSREHWRNTKEYRVYRARVIRRDKKCEICGTIKKREVHHTFDAHHHYRKRFVQKYGRVLCKRHHKLIHMLNGGYDKEMTPEIYCKLLLAFDVCDIEYKEYYIS